MADEVINFSAGPAKLPREVLEEVQKEVIQFGNSCISVMELSHRCTTYDDIHNNTIALFKELLNIPDNYKILLIQGGGNGMFASIPLNLISKTGEADYVVTGIWSKKAAKEAEKYGKVNVVNTPMKKGDDIPDPSTWNLNPNASYLYYCDNETVNGLEFPYVPDSKGVTLVCDMSSNILTRKIDVTKYGLIFAGVQKNLGPAGLAVAIVREDLIGNAMSVCPSILDFDVMAKNNSLYNTPPTYIIYVVGKVLQYVKKNGGVENMEKLSAIKSKIVYDVINESEGFYYNEVNPNCRSRINITFRLKGGPDMEKKFLKLAEEQAKMVQLKGHRLVGGIRASLFNAMTVEETAKLVGFMRLFESEYKFDVAENGS